MFIAPIVGAIIGYITNDLAIKMLFHPRRSVYIGNFHIPFTPGLIPQQKNRIAKSIGKLISNQLLNTETLRQTILSEGTIYKLRKKVKEFLDSFAYEQRTVFEMLKLYFATEQIEEQSDKFERKIAELVTNKILQVKIGNVVVDMGMKHIRENEATKKLISFLFDNEVGEHTKQRLAEKIDKIIEAEAPGIIYREIDKVKETVMSTKICDLYDQYQDKEDALIDAVISTYVSLIGDNLDKLIEAVNIEQIVVNKISAFDAVELEKMIFGIMKRELKAIVYLGALLGFFMGFINLLF